MDDAHRVNTESLYREAESRTNRDNVRCLIILALIFLLCDFLNEIGLFDVSTLVMRLGTAVGALFFLMPALILYRPLCLFQRGAKILVYRSWYKYLIIAFVWLGTIVAGITLTHHAVILNAIPVMIMTQYRDTRKLIFITVVLATVSVFLGVYGGYFWGCFDGNLLHLAITDDNVADLALRLKMATPRRMYHLFTHYVIARELTVLALILLASRISHRSNAMLDRQVELQTIAEAEMRKKNAIQWQIIDGMANLIENRDTSTGEHVKRTGFYVRNIVEQLRKDPTVSQKLTANEAETIVRAAPLHDIGKIVIADRILQKPGKLTPDEFNEIKYHAAEGVRVIKNVLGNVEDERFLRAATEIAGGHHERYDGKGYPNGLKGDEIPLSARIMAVADVFDALVSKRVYKEAMPPDDAFTVIESESGKQFDPQVVSAFLSLRPTIQEYLKSAS